MEIESDKKNQVKVKIAKKESDPLSMKFESVKQEYNIIIKNLMDAKKELKNINENIQKSNSEYANIVSKTKFARIELLKANSELQKKTEEDGKATEEYKKQKLLIQETNSSKKELSEIKDEIVKYGKELEYVRTNVDNSPDIKKLKEEREEIENEINKKRFELESGFRELKFIYDEMAKSRFPSPSRSAEAADPHIWVPVSKGYISSLKFEGTNFSLNDEEFKQISDLANKVNPEILMLFWQFTIKTMDELEIVSNQSLSISSIDGSLE